MRSQSEMASDRESSEREISEEPGSLYDDGEMISGLDEEAGELELLKLCSGNP